MNSPARPKVSVFIARSLDGFIARPDGQLDWLQVYQSAVPAGEDCGFAAFMASVDVLFMGRHTFDTVQSFNAWPYGDTPVWVLSHHPETLGNLPATVSVVAGEPAELLTRCAQQGFQHVYLDGGLCVQQFIQAGLVDEMIITTLPILIGAGRPLFAELSADIVLEIVHHRVYPFHFTQTHYRLCSTPTPQLANI